MLRIDKELFQWERGRYVFLDKEDTDVTHVWFYNQKVKSSKEVEVVDGKAKIPNILLESSSPIMAVACNVTDTSSIALFRREFKVIARKIPESMSDDDDDDSEEIIYDGGVIN